MSATTDLRATDPLKAWRTAQAEAILAGHVAHLGTDDTGKPELIVSRWALTRAFSDLGEFGAWLARVGKAS